MHDWSLEQEIPSMKPSRATPLVAILCALAALPALASPINVDTGKALNLNSGSSGILTLSLTNLNSGSSITTFNGWGLILQLIPQPGSASLLSMTEPASNPALTDPGDPPLFDTAYVLNSAVNGTTDAYQAANGNNTNVTTTFTLGQSYNIADLTVLLSPGATGSWKLFALNDENNTGAWLNPQGNATAFGNLATPSAGQYTSLEIGTITAVPEPSTIALLGMSVASAGWYAWRSRRKVTIETVESA
jgi:PEP-CTERM motif